MQSLVIVGGGFAGVWAAFAAANARRRSGSPARRLTITLVSRDPYLTIRPRLYEADLDGVRAPLRSLFGVDEVSVVEGDVTNIDTAARELVISDGGELRSLPYDRLVFAAGSMMREPRVPGAEHLHSVDSFSAASRLRSHLKTAPRAAVVVGAGFTGIEVATSLIRRIPKITVVDRASAVAPDLGPHARWHVEKALRSLGIGWVTDAGVEEVTDRGVRLAGGRWIDAGTVVWTGGFVANPLTSSLSAERDVSGRIPVDQHLRVPHLDGVYAAGDVAAAVADVEQGQIAPMSCQCAIPMGEVAGHNAAADLLGHARTEFSHRHYVTCLDLGDAGALFTEGWSRDVKLDGFWASQIKRHINQVLIDPRHARAAA